jgi:hypothetical protein
MVPGIAISTSGGIGITGATDLKAQGTFFLPVQGDPGIALHDFFPP